MKVISLHQPWASWVALGWKTIETRTHTRFKNLVGETIGIHAAKHWDNKWYVKSKNSTTDNQIINTQSFIIHNCPLGQLIATAYVEDFRKLQLADSIRAMCYCGNDDLFGLILSDIAPIKPVSLKGMQGIFNYNGELIYL